MNYSQLPEDIAEKIVKEHLETFPQLVAFSRICTSWRSTALRLHGGRLRCLPWLVVSKATTTAPQSALEAYYDSGQTHQFYPLVALFPAKPQPRPWSWPPPPPPPPPPSPPPRAIPFVPDPSKISDAQGQRQRYLRLLDDLLTSFDPHSSDDDDYNNLKDAAAQSLGSKDGWILRTVTHPRAPAGRALELYLLNPITGASIPLPPLQHSSPPTLICKAIISSSPDDDGGEECHVIILSTSDPQLAWCNVSSGSEQCWNLSSSSSSSKDSHIFESPHDAICFGGNLYVVDCRRIYVIDYRRLGSSDSAAAAASPVVRAFSFSETMISCCSDDSDSDSYYNYDEYHVRDRERMACYHLFQLDGELHVVCREYYHQVYKLVVVTPAANEGGSSSSSSKYYWEEVRSLNGRAVFIGGHQSFCLPAAASTTVVGNGADRGNRIYFALGCGRTRRRQRRSGCGGWNGVFHLANRRFERSDLQCCTSDEKSCSSSSFFWFLPMPWDISKLHRKHHDRRKKKAWKRERYLLGTANETGDPYYWTLPKKTVKNKNHHHHHHNDNNIVENVRHNRFRALLSDADNEEDEED